MPSLLWILSAVPALLTVAHSQGIIIKAQGTKGSPASLGLQVSTTSTDANIIRKAEITNNIVNECGRTLLAGNIDIGATTEDQLANKTVTSVTNGSTVAVTIRTVSADGAGPYTCDLDVTSNSEGATGQVPLTVTEKNGTNGDLTLSVTMPTAMACVGGSTGNVCTVRCLNSATAGPFGGCFAVQQTDITPKVNTVTNIQTAATLAGIMSQVLVDNKGLAAAEAASNQATTEAQQGVSAVNALLKITPRSLDKAGGSRKRGGKGTLFFS